MRSCSMAVIETCAILEMLSRTRKLCKQNFVLVNIDLGCRMWHSCTTAYSFKHHLHSRLCDAAAASFCNWALNMETESSYDEAVAINCQPATMCPRYICLQQIVTPLFLANAFSTRCVRPAVSRHHRRIFVQLGHIAAAPVWPCARTQNVPRLEQDICYDVVFARVERWSDGERREEKRSHGSIRVNVT